MMNNDETKKKIKHREVERVRHHKLQTLINELSEIVPDNSQNTQCAILKKAADYVDFLIAEYNRMAAIIEVDGYSSSQATVTSSQGNLIIDENYQEREHVQITCTVDPDYGVEEDNNKFPTLPSSLLSSDQEYFDFTSPPLPIPINYQSPKWIDNRFDYISPYPSPPSTSTSPPPLPQYIHPQMEQKNFNQQSYLPHCSSCSCFSSPNFNLDNPNNNSNKSFVPRDHLLTETIQDNYLNDQWS